MVLRGINNLITLRCSKYKFHTLLSHDCTHEKKLLNDRNNWLSIIGAMNHTRHNYLLKRFGDRLLHTSAMNIVTHIKTQHDSKHNKRVAWKMRRCEEWDYFTHRIDFPLQCLSRQPRRLRRHTCYMPIFAYLISIAQQTLMVCQQQRLPTARSNFSPD
jgi:hypothetical protein